MVEITIMTRARATSCAVADSAASPMVDRLGRRVSDKFMTSPTPMRTSVLVAPEEAGERLDRLLARRVGELVSVHVIPRPHDEVEKALLSGGQKK